MPSRRRAAAGATVLSVFKLRIGVLIMLTALGGIGAGPGAGGAAAGRPGDGAGGAGWPRPAPGAFNQYVEADSDRLMAHARPRLRQRRAARRPGLAGADRRAAGGGVGGGLGLGSTAWPPAHLFLGAFTYGVVYTVWLKRRTLDEHRHRRPGRQLRGARRRRRGRPAAWGPLPLLLALVLFLWTPPHFWSLAIANRDDYAAAGVPMLPVVVGVERAARIVHVGTVALVAASLLPVLLRRGAGLPRGRAAAVALHFLRKHAWAGARPAADAMGAFFASMVQLSGAGGGGVRSMRMLALPLGDR
jgi:protoheme IX farnesyltransferase